jgi:hypothetical protein
MKLITLGKNINDNNIINSIFKRFFELVPFFIATRSFVYLNLFLQSLTLLHRQGTSKITLHLSLETACRQSRMWLKKPNPGLTRYLLRLPRSKLRILVGLITGHCPLNKHMHNMGLIDEPICIACGMEDESAFHLLCNCPSLISLRMRLFSKPILSVEEYEGRLRLHFCDSRW